MQKQTLKFDNLMSLSSFARKLSSGYMINTLNLTITSKYSEEEIGLGIELNADPIEDGRGVFTKIGVIRARAVQADFPGSWKQTVIFVGNRAKHAIAELPAEEVEQAADLACASGLKFDPGTRSERLDGDADIVQ